MISNNLSFFFLLLTKLSDLKVHLVAVLGLSIMSHGLHHQMGVLNFRGFFFSKHEDFSSMLVLSLSIKVHFRHWKKASRTI